MSEFAFFRFKSTNMLTRDEEQHKDEIIKLTEEVLESKGIECDSRIAKISEEQLREILEEVLPTPPFWEAMDTIIDKLNLSKTQTGYFDSVSYN